MIPKTIHYCWFGGKSLPRSARKCIESWRRMLPDYEIREWNESNFDVDAIPYTLHAYRLGKFAFVSDYARYRILFSHGGLYFDTDVEIIRPIDDIVEAGPFLGVEKNRGSVSVNPGLGMGAEAQMPFYREILEKFEEWVPECPPEPLLIRATTELLRSKGWKATDEMQSVEGLNIYPNEYFNPKDDYTGKIHLTPRTRSIHHYAKTWVEGYGPLRNRLTQFYHRLKNLN